MADFHHPLVGKTVMYRPKHGNPEQGVITSIAVRPTGHIAFVRYGNSSTSAATRAGDLTLLNGLCVDSEIEYLETCSLHR